MIFQDFLYGTANNTVVHLHIDCTVIIAPGIIPWSFQPLPLMPEKGEDGAWLLKAVIANVTNVCSND